MQRLLFCVRSEPDLERFAAILFHLSEHCALVVDLSGRSEWPPSLHRDLLSRIGGVRRWSDLLETRLDRPRPATTHEIEAILREWRPDLVVLDQFGPGCPRWVTDCRDLSHRLGITTCMIPHGVRTTYFPDAPRPRRAGPPAATAVFYTSEAHRREAEWFFNPVGTFQSVLGDPRFDRAHLIRLADCRLDRSETREDEPRLAFFGANLSVGLVDAISRSGGRSGAAQLNRRMLTELARGYQVRARAHPRVPMATGPEYRISTKESIDLSTWADVVATPISSVVLEGLALGRSAVVLDVERLAPGWKSIFTPHSTPVQCEGLPLRRLEHADALLMHHAWAGQPDGVARAYARCIETLAAGRPAAMLHRVQ